MSDMLLVQYTQLTAKGSPELTRVVTKLAAGACATLPLPLGWRPVGCVLCEVCCVLFTVCKVLYVVRCVVWPLCSVMYAMCCVLCAVSSVLCCVLYVHNAMADVLWYMDGVTSKEVRCMSR